MEKIKQKAECLIAAAYDLVGKNKVLEKDSLLEAARLLAEGQYESVAGWLDIFVRIEGARLIHMSPLCPGSLLADRSVTIAKPSDLHGQTTIYSLCGDE